MLPSDMTLKIKTGTVGYNNKIFVSDENFSLGKNVEVNSLALEEPVIPMPKMNSHKTNPLGLGPQTPLHGAQKPNISH